MTRKIEIVVGDVNDVEAHIIAKCDGVGGELAVLSGTIRGPYCEKAHTLPAEFAFRSLGPGTIPQAEAVVSDPCTWSPELPHVYHVDVEARQGARIVAEHHGQLGLKRSAPRRGGMAFPG